MYQSNQRNLKNSFLPGRGVVEHQQDGRLIFMIDSILKGILYPAIINTSSI